MLTRIVSNKNFTLTPKEQNLLSDFVRKAVGSSTFLKGLVPLLKRNRPEKEEGGDHFSRRPSHVLVSEFTYTSKVPVVLSFKRFRIQREDGSFEVRWVIHLFVNEGDRYPPSIQVGDYSVEGAIQKFQDSLHGGSDVDDFKEEFFQELETMREADPDSPVLQYIENFYSE